MVANLRRLQMIARNEIINGDSPTDDEEIINKSIADTMEVLGHNRKETEELLSKERC